MQFREVVRLTPSETRNSEMDLVIGVVGKPNVGKSSFLNVSTDAHAKVGDFPFTTIEPNVGVSHFSCPCACKRFGKEGDCKPRYGACVGGVRRVPVKVLDVAGLVPGASKGLGLGNKFLDDLRHAHVLIHVIDSSGTTNEKGEKTSGYDPCADADWLQSEIEEWVFSNIFPRWNAIARRHCVGKKPVLTTLQSQLGGYGARKCVVQQVIRKLGLVDPVDLQAWQEDDVRKFVRVFLDERFKTVLMLNKIDKKESEKWIPKLLERYGDEQTVLCSAASELFLKQLVKKKHIRYESGAEEVEAEGEGLVAMDDGKQASLQNIRDLILYRFGSTGVVTAINKAVELANVVPVYIVKSIHNFTCGNEPGCFRDVMIVRAGTTVGEIAETVSGKEIDFVECGQTGQRIASEAPVTQENNCLRFVFKETERRKEDDY